jgi:hypothetical protein
VQVQVALERRPDLATTEIGCRLPQFDQSVGLAAGPRLGDDLGGLRADTRQRLPAVGLAVLLALGVVESLDGVGGVAVGHHAARVLAGAVLVIGNLAQRGYGIHGSSVPRWLPALAEARPASSGRVR